VLVSSHVLAEIAQTADEVIVIHRGRSIRQAPLDELMAGGGGGVRVAGQDAGRLAELLRADGASVARDGRDGAILVPDRSGEQIGHLIATHRIVISALAPGSSSLEEIFLELTDDHNGGPS
jgi:ABC-2 type transport system ATP-binding protein